MTAPHTPAPSDTPVPAPTAEYYEKIVTTPRHSSRTGRYILLALLLLLTGGEVLYIRHVRANDRLRDAVLQDDAEQTRDMLRLGADPNQRYVSALEETPGLWRYIPGVRSAETTSTKGKTLLMIAAGAGRSDVTRTLLEHGANPNVKSASGMTALLAASGARDPLTVKLLLDKGADLRVHDSEGHAPLHLAARLGNVETLTTLLDNKADLEAKDMQGETALFLAAANHQEEAVKLLLARGADIDSLSAAQTDRSNAEQRSPSQPPTVMQEHTTPLLWAAQLGSPSLVSAIWDKRMDADARLNYGILALMRAAQSGSAETVKALLERGVEVETPVPTTQRQSPSYYYFTPLMIAAGQHNPAICRLLLDKGANVNRQDEGGLTPLLAAATASNGEVVDLLLARGAEVNVHNAQGETPLMVACNSLDATRALLAHGADVNARDNHGNTALMHSQNNDVMRLLLQHGADAHSHSVDTMLLARATTADVVALLIAHGANVNERDSRGKTALMRTFYDPAIPALIEHGADVNMRDYAGRTALHDAVSQMSLQRVNLLIAHGANVNAAATNGETPLSLAKQRNYALVIDALVKAGATK